MEKEFEIDQEDPIPLPKGFVAVKKSNGGIPLPKGFEQIKKKESFWSGLKGGGGTGGVGLSIGAAAAQPEKLPIADIEDYNKQFRSATGLPEFSLGSDLPQIKKAREEKEFTEFRNIEEKEIKPVISSVQSGTADPKQLAELYQKPYGKKVVKDLINQQIPGAADYGLDPEVFGSEINWQELAAKIQEQNRPQGVEAANQQEFALDSELSNDFKNYSYGSERIAIEGRDEAVRKVDKNSFGEINTTSFTELEKARKDILRSSKLWDAEGNEVDKKQLLKKIQAKQFQLKAQENLHPQIVELSDKIKEAVSKVPVEWKRQGGDSSLATKDGEYVMQGLNYLRDTSPGEYAMVMGAIDKLGKMSETQYQDLVELGRDMDYYRKFKSGEYVEQDTRSFMTPEVKKAHLAGWLTDELSRQGKNKRIIAVKQDDIINAYKNVPEELKDDQLLNEIILAERGPAFGFLPIPKGEGIPKRGLGRQILTNTAQPFRNIQNSIDVSVSSPFQSYLDSKELDRSDQLIFDKKTGGYTDKADDTFFNKAVGGLFNVLTQAFIARGIGGVTAKGTNAIIGTVAPRAATATTGGMALSVGTPLSTLSQTFGDEFIDFLEKTGSPTKAAFGAFVSGVVQGQIERFVMPDVKIAEDIALLTSRRNLAKEIIKVVDNGGDKAAIGKLVQDFVLNTSKTLGKEAFLEENLQNLTNRITEQIISPKTAIDRDIAQETIDVTSQAFTQAAFASILGGAGKTKIERGLNKAQLHHIGANYKTYQEALDRQLTRGLMSQQEYDKASEIIKLHGTNVSNSPKRDANGEIISATRQLEYAYQSTVAEIAAQQTEKISDKIQQEPLLKKIEEADKIKRSIFYGEESRDLMDEGGQDLPQDKATASTPEEISQPIAGSGGVVDVDLKSEYDKDILYGLKQRAKHFDNFKDFSHDYSIKGNHGIYFHLTDNPNFKYSAETGARDMSSMASGSASEKGSLMVTSDLQGWHDYYNLDPDTELPRDKGGRKYVAIVDLSNVKKIPPSERGFGHEIYLNKLRAKNAKVVKVVPIEEALKIDKDFHDKMPQSEKALKKIWDDAQKNKPEKIGTEDKKFNKISYLQQPTVDDAIDYANRFGKEQKFDLSHHNLPKDRFKTVLKVGGETVWEVRGDNKLSGYEMLEDYYENSTLADKVRPKAVEQSLKETTKAETLKNENTTNQADTKADEPIPPKEAGVTKTASTEAGEGAIPPAEPPKVPVAASEEKEGGKKKAVLNRLYEAENVPQKAREHFKKVGLDYKPSSQEEAVKLAKAIVDELGIDEALEQAEKFDTFDGDVRTFIFTEALDRLQGEENAVKWAEVAETMDKFERSGGRAIAAVGYFYKHNPYGVVLRQKAKLKEEFNEWSKPKDKSWKEYYGELMKVPEFADLVKAEVKAERAAERTERKERVHKSIDDMAAKWAKKLKPKTDTGGAKLSGIDADTVMKAVAKTMKAAYDAGESVAKLIQDAVDYISEKFGATDWGSDEFKQDWEKKLAERGGKKPVTDEEIKIRVLDKFRKKLKGLSDKQKEEVIIKSYQEIIKNGGLEYPEFKDIIASVTGMGKMTKEQEVKMQELVTKANSVGAASKRLEEERTPEAIENFYKTELEAGKATKELQELFATKPDILKRLVSIAQLSTLGPASLLSNVTYNIWGQMGLRFPVGVVNDLVDRMLAGAAKLAGKTYTKEYNIMAAQAGYFEMMGLGGKEAIQQFYTGLNRMDYTQKEIWGQKIRPAKSIRDLIAWKRGKKKLTSKQVLDKSIQASVGIPAEAVARLLNVGDKPFRFAAEGATAAQFAKSLGLKDIDQKIFMILPREEAYRAYKGQGFSDEVAGQKADYIKEAIVKEGQRATFQQDNLLMTRVINPIFGRGSSGIGEAIKVLTISPYIKIPSNAFWSYYNLLNPEVAILQSFIHGGRAKVLSTKGEYTSSKLAQREARYWMSHAVVGIATRAVIISLVKAGLFTPGSDEDDSKKERDAINYFSKPGTMQIGNTKVSNRWLAQFGMMGNAIARQWNDLTPEQRENQDEFWRIAFSGMELEGLQEFENGIFANTSSLIQLFDGDSYAGGRYFMNMINMMTNIVQPATVAQINRAALDYVPSSRGDNFLDRLNKNFAQRSTLYRNVFKVQLERKKDIWGQDIPKGGNILSRMFGISKANPQIFARPLYDDYLRTGDSGFLPPAVFNDLPSGKLTSEQLSRLESYIGQARKNKIEPYINDMAEIPAIKEFYSKIKDDETKKKILKGIYADGREIGLLKFYKDFPQFRPKEKTDGEMKQDILIEAANKIIKVKK